MFEMCVYMFVCVDCVCGMNVRVCVSNAGIIRVCGMCVCM